MGIYQYKAIDREGHIRSGEIDAANAIDLELRLHKMSFDLINYKENSHSTGRLLANYGIKRRDLILFCFHLEQTSRAGVPMLDSLRDLRDSTENPRMAEIMNTFVESIEGGDTLSQAMIPFENVFGKVFINLIIAGEKSGQMSQIFEKLGESIKWQDEQTSQAKRLLMYPAIVGSVVFGVVIFLMTYLVPQLLGFLKTMGHELPFHTKLLIFVSNIFVHYWYLILSLPIVLVIVINIGVKTNPLFRLAIDDLKLKMPLVGPILKKIILTRITSFFAIMYESGITIVECIKISEEIAGNASIARAMNHVSEQIAAGVTLSDSFESAGLFPPLVLRMIRVGETTGALKNALVNVGYFYTRDVKESIEKIQSLISPTMTIVLAFFIIWVIISVLGPIYDLIATIKI